MEDKKVMAGARISRSLWLRFTAEAKLAGETVADRLEALIRQSLGEKQKPKRRTAGS